RHYDTDTRSVFLLLYPYYSLFFLLMIHHTPRSTLFPYTTLFRSKTKVKIQIGIISIVVIAIVVLAVFMVKQNKVIADLESQRDKDRKSTRLNSSHVSISYAVFCLKKKKKLLYKHIINT